MIRELSDEVLDQLLRDHWREIQGILKELKRRGSTRKYYISNPD